MRGKTDEFVHRYGTLKFPFSTRTPAKWAKVCVDNTRIATDKMMEPDEKVTPGGEAVLDSLALGHKSLFFNTWRLQKPSVIISMAGLPY